MAVITATVPTISQMAIQWMRSRVWPISSDGSRAMSPSSGTASPNATTVTRDSLARPLTNSTNPFAPNIRFAPFIGEILDTWGLGFSSAHMNPVCPTLATSARTTSSPMSGNRIQARSPNSSTNTFLRCGLSMAMASGDSMNFREVRLMSRMIPGAMTIIAKAPPRRIIQLLTSWDEATWPLSRAFSSFLAVGSSVLDASSSSAMGHPEDCQGTKKTEKPSSKRDKKTIIMPDMVSANTEIWIAIWIGRPTKNTGRAGIRRPSRPRPR